MTPNTGTRPPGDELEINDPSPTSGRHKLTLDHDLTGGSWCQGKGEAHFIVCCEAWQILNGTYLAFVHTEHRGIDKLEA